MELTDNDAVMMSSPTSPTPSSSQMQFLQPPPSQNCLICSESVGVVESSDKNRKVCEIFCRVACRYLNFKIGNFSPPEQTIRVRNVINKDNCGILCENCFPLAESFCKIYNKFQYLEQLFRSRMKESIDKIRVQMEKVQDDDDDEMEARELNKENLGQVEFRHNFVRRGKQKLCEGVPIVQLDRQGLDLDSETDRIKIIINILETPEDSDSEKLLRDPCLEIKTEQELLEVDDDDYDEEDIRGDDLSNWCEICNKEFTQISDSEFQRHRKSCGSETVGRNIEHHESVPTTSTISMNGQSSTSTPQNLNAESAAEALQSVQNNQQLILAKLDINQDLLRTLLAGKNASRTRPTETPKHNLSIRLPFADIITFKEFDKKMRTDDNLRERLITLLSTTGGNDGKQIVYRIMAELLSDDLMQLYTFKGQGQRRKENFSETIFFSCIYEAATRQPKAQSLTKKEAEKAVDYWLRKATTRINNKRAKAAGVPVQD